MKHLAIFVFAITVALGVSARGQNSSQTRTVPNAPWVKIYFESIDRLAGQMKLKALRAVRLGSDGIELRVWESGGSLTGYVIKRSDGKWSARAARQRSRNSVEELKVPSATDWATVWAKLYQAGLADIRDDSDNPACAMVLDGVAYVVEIAQGSSYRTYLVSNPQSARTEDGDRFLALLPALLEAFGEKPPVDVTTLPIRERQIVSSVVPQMPEQLDTHSPAWASAEVLLRTEEALAQVVSIRTPGCEELPAQAKLMPLSRFGEVAVELLIEPDGTVRSARALSGHFPLRSPSVDAASKWRFTSIPGGQLRGAVLTIRYRNDWVDLPWLKKSPRS